MSNAMASIRGLFNSAAGLSILLTVLALLHCGSAQMCSFWESGCIDPLAQTAVPIDFSPLFPDPITFFYAFDELISGKGQGPMTKTSYWLRYQDRNINKDAVTSNRTSEIALRVGNLTGTPSGTTNGCDGIWGVLAPMISKALCSIPSSTSLPRANTIQSLSKRPWHT